MRRSLVLLSLVLVTLPLSAGRHNDYYRGNHGLTVNTDDWDPITSCNQIKVTYDGERVPVVEEDVNVSNVRSLRMRPSHNGGVIVTGDASTYSVKACKAAYLGGSTSSVRIDTHGDTVSADMPDDVEAVVYFIVRAPRDGSVDLEATNGPISVRDMTGGTISARTSNGPISLKNVSGNVTAEAHNGPIAFVGNSGNVKLEAQNGPISVNLDGSYWSNGSLDASTHNGPLSLKMPSSYRSGVVVESDGHGPVSCRADACREAKRTWDDDSSRRIELGSGPQAVHLSTVNGPVSVRERD